MRQEEKFTFTKIKDPKIEDVKKACKYLEIIYSNDRYVNIENAEKSYKKKSLKFHPDKNKDGEEEFKEINAAYEIIKSYIPQRSLSDEKSINNFPDNKFRNFHYQNFSSYSDYHYYESDDTFFTYLLFLLVSIISSNWSNIKSTWHKKNKVRTVIWRLLILLISMIMLSLVFI